MGWEIIPVRAVVSESQDINSVQYGATSVKHPDEINTWLDVRIKKELREENMDYCMSVMDYDSDG